MSKIAPHIQKMCARVPLYQQKVASLSATDGEDVITVDKIVSRLSNLYEKMRYSVDAKDEHLLRRNAIERMLKRRLLENFRRGSIGYFLVSELVRAGYLPNNTLPERVVTDVERVVQKALALHGALPHSSQDALSTSDEFDRVMNIAAMEIESILFPSEAAEATVNGLYLTVRDLIELREVDISDDAKNIQTFLACNRSVNGDDDPGLFYRLWLLHVPSWREDLTDEAIVEVAAHFDMFKEKIESEIAHPLNWRLMPKLRDYAIYFSLMRESIEAEPEKWSAKTISLADIRKNLSEVIAEKYRAEQNVIKKSVSRAIWYIILTKIILAFTFELPYDYFVIGAVNKMALFINVFFHPVLLFFITRVVRYPKKESRDHTLESIFSIIEGKTQPLMTVRIAPEKSLFGIILTLIYTFFFVLIFGSIIWILEKIGFNIVSGFLFLFFLTLVSYLGLRIRGRAKKWRVIPKKETARGFIIDLLTLPIVHAGQWFMKKFASINIFVFVLDFIIETPFKMLIEIFEGFTRYLREKKESLE